MNTTYRGILTLCRNAITGEQLLPPEGFRLEQADDLIRAQGLVPLVYRGAYNCSFAQESDTIRQYEQQYYRLMFKDARQRQALDQLFQAFEEAGIDYMPLKGCNLKKMYPQPEMRIMGDADVLIRLKQYGEISYVMEKLNYSGGKESSYDFAWRHPNLFVELHKSLFPPVNEDLCSYFGDGWGLSIRGRGHQYHLSCEDEYAYIFAHMAKHFRSRGIGARQIIDLYVYRKSNPQIDERKIEYIVSKLHMRDFYHNILSVLDVWFEDAQTDPLTEYMTEYIFSSGCWGTLENELIANELLKVEKRGAIKQSKLSVLIDSVFLPLNQMQQQYNVLYKYPWLLPIFWVVRWFRSLLFNSRRMRKRLVALGKIDDEKVKQRREMLNYMGLDFHYEDEKLEDI